MEAGKSKVLVLVSVHSFGFLLMPPWLADGHLLTVSSHHLSSAYPFFVLFFACTFMRPNSSTYKDIGQIGLGPTLMALI